MFIYKNTKTGKEVTVPCKVNGDWELVKEIGKEKKAPSKPSKVEVQEEVQEKVQEDKKPITRKRR